MLGNCLLRNPVMQDDTLDKGAICEVLLFFGRAHLVLDTATLGSIVKANFLDDLIIMLKAGYLTGNYSPQAPVLYTDKRGALQEHFFTVAKFSGEQGKPNMRNPELLESQLARSFDDKSVAKKYYRELAKLISFKDLQDHDVSRLAKNDISDPFFAKEVIRAALIGFGVPETEINLSKFDIFPLAENKFAISANIDLDPVRKFIPDVYRDGFGLNNLVVSLGDARWDIGLAANQNAAFVGNERYRAIINMIMQRSLGVKFGPGSVPRDIYDFISVDTASVREVINKGERTPQEFIKLMEKAEVFRKWLRKQNPNSDLVTEMLREKARVDWLDSLPVKAIRFGLFTGGGFLADLHAPGASIAGAAIDNFLIDKLGKNWRPHYFVENHLRSFLDTVGS
jgi:hypothetical protein